MGRVKVWVGFRFGLGLKSIVMILFEIYFLRLGGFWLNKSEVFVNLAFESPYLNIFNIRLNSNANQFGLVYGSPEKIEAVTINAKRRKGQVNIDLLVYFNICCSDRPLF